LLNHANNKAQMPAKKASTAQLKLVSSADLSAAARLAVPSEPPPAERASAQTLPPPTTPFERAFQAALRAERRIGDVLEAEWKLAGDDVAEQLRLSAFALMAHDDPYADLFEANAWAERLNNAIAACEDSFAQDDALAFWQDAGMLASQQSSGRATQEVFDACIERVRRGAAPSANEWLYLATMCIAEANSCLKFAAACALVEIAQAHSLISRAASVVVARWKYTAAYTHFLAQDFPQAVSLWEETKLLINQMIELEKTSNLRLSPGAFDSLRVELAVALTRVAVEEDRIDFAQSEMASVREPASKSVAITRVSYHHMMSRVSLRLGKSLDALHHLDVAREILRLQFADPGYWPVVLTEYLQVLFSLGRWQDAVRTADEFKPYFVRHGLQYGEFLRQAALARLWAESPSGDCEIPFTTSLQAAFDLAVKYDYRSFVRSVPVFASWLCAMALERHIHDEFVREVITSRKLPTPPRAPRQWPWAVWLDLIGPFAITLNGQRLVLTGKVAQKPLELIKLLACTKRYTLSLESAAMQLWPDAEDLSAARKNLETTIGRARKLIGDASIKVGEGRVQLDAALAGSDLQYVLDTCTEAEALAHRGGTLPQLIRATEQLSDLYEGELLQAEEELPWLNAARQHLRNCFVRATLALASALERHQFQTEEITRLLETAISRESLAEQLYAKLMQHYAAQGRKAEALHTFRRCRQSLSVIANLTPSRETEVLKEQLLL
jgi:DNA-binding SARP family transcriptional activator